MVPKYIWSGNTAKFHRFWLIRKMVLVPCAIPVHKFYTLRSPMPSLSWSSSLLLVSSPEVSLSLSIDKLPPYFCILKSTIYIPIYSPIISKSLKVSKIIEIPHHIRFRPCPCGRVPTMGPGDGYYHPLQMGGRGSSSPRPHSLREGGGGWAPLLPGARPRPRAS
jgi:hypothetical protein